MSNNRLCLIDEKTGETVWLGKYYPETGYCVCGDIEEKIQNFFNQTSVGKGMTGPRYRLQFDVEPDASKGIREYLGEKIQAAD